MASYKAGSIQAEVDYEREACGADVYSFDVTIGTFGGLSIRGTMGHAAGGPKPTLDDVLKHVEWILQKDGRARQTHGEWLEAHLQSTHRSN